MTGGYLSLGLVSGGYMSRGEGVVLSPSLHVQRSCSSTEDWVSIPLVLLSIVKLDEQMSCDV